MNNECNDNTPFTSDNKLNLDLYCNEFDYLFWSKVFLEHEINQLKTLINNNENNLENIISTIMPSYQISQKFSEYNNIYYNEIINRSHYDIFKSKNILAGILILIGILTHKFIQTNQDYVIIIKGGKAIQLLISNNNCVEFASNDIDILLMHINGLYDYNKLKNLSRQISLLIIWIFNMSNNIQIQPFVNYAYPYIDKISYVNQDGKYYTALVDIDFGIVTNNIFYENLDITIYDHEFFGKIMFKYQNINNLVFEKLFYVNHYATQYEQICNNPLLYPLYFKIYYDSYRFIIKFAKQLNILFVLSCETSTTHLSFQEKAKIMSKIIHTHKILFIDNLIDFVIDTDNIMNNSIYIYI